VHFRAGWAHGTAWDSMAWHGMAWYGSGMGRSFDYEVMYLVNYVIPTVTNNFHIGCRVLDKEHVPIRLPDVARGPLTCALKRRAIRFASALIPSPQHSRSLPAVPMLQLQ
jgi:hypothetical protein